MMEGIAIAKGKHGTLKQLLRGNYASLPDGSPKVNMRRRTCYRYQVAKAQGKTFWHPCELCGRDDVNLENIEDLLQKQFLIDYKEHFGEIEHVDLQDWYRAQLHLARLQLEDKKLPYKERRFRKSRLDWTGLLKAV